MLWTPWQGTTSTTNGEPGQWGLPSTKQTPEGGQNKSSIDIICNDDEEISMEYTRKLPILVAVKKEPREGSACQWSMQCVRWESHTCVGSKKKNKKRWGAPLSRAFIQKENILWPACASTVLMWGCTRTRKMNTLYCDTGSFTSQLLWCTSYYWSWELIFQVSQTPSFYFSFFSFSLIVLLGYFNPSLQGPLAKETVMEVIFRGTPRWGGGADTFLLCAIFTIR